MAGPMRTVRVFISSTFRDMHAERDHLVRFVFPELKERCRKIRVQLIDVDLRWGVTEEDANAGKALDICLDEIDMCRPYFLGLLGFRYGYIPPGHQHSITAQEIYHGVLHTDLPKQVPDLQKILEGKLEGKRLSDKETSCLARCYRWDGEKRKHILTEDVSGDEEHILRSVFRRYSIYQRDRSYFFFRSEALTHQLAADHPEDFYETDPQELTRLKEEIRTAGLPVHDYNDLETFGRIVCDTLWTRIEADSALPVAEKDSLEEEAELHELFMADRTRRFVGRRDVLDRMHAFCEGRDEASVLLITGEPGCGKSALMSRFTEEIIHQHPDWLIHSHFVGASPASTNLREMLHRLCIHLKRTQGSTEEVPEDVEGLQFLLPVLLARSAEARKVLIVIDAINQTEKTGNSRSLSWLPQQIFQEETGRSMKYSRRSKRNIRFIISTLASEARDLVFPSAIRCRIEVLRGLTPEEVRLLVGKYLREIRHEFPNRQVEADFFAKNEQGNPLFILVALEELRVFGKFEELGNRIQCLPDNVPDLFDQVLDRIEGDFNAPLVRDCMKFIACSRSGMTAEELQFLLKQHGSRDGHLQSVKLPDLLWSRLYRSFRAYLFERSRVIDFFHGQLKAAVEKRYLSDQANRKTTHQNVADYFKRRWQEPYPRALYELPHQLTYAEDRAGLEEVLCDLDFIESKCSAGIVTDHITLLRKLEPSSRGPTLAFHYRCASISINFVNRDSSKLRKYAEPSISGFYEDIG